MALLKGHKRNFKTLQQAFANGDVALMECQSATTGETVAVICAANGTAEDEIEFVPFATLFNGNPYEAVNPPNPDGGYFTQEETWGQG